MINIISIGVSRDQPSGFYNSLTPENFGSWETRITKLQMGDHIVEW
jgi:hypothetical protein